jgi:hypothetical protein
VTSRTQISDPARGVPTIPHSTETHHAPEIERRRQPQGLPAYGSIGASCNLEVELENGLLDHDLEGFHARVKKAYVAAHQAVVDELARHHALADGEPAGANGHADQDAPARDADTATPPARSRGQWGPPARTTNGHGKPPQPRRPASEKQLKAIAAIARAQGADLEGLLRAEFGVERPEALSMAQASELIDQLRAAAEV